MKILKITFLVLFLVGCSLSAQGLTIGSGTTFTGGSATITLSGNWSNSGTFTPGASTVVFDGASGNQTITNTNGETFYNLTVNKVADDLQLINNIDASGVVTVTSGDLDLNGNILALVSSGILSETAGNTVKGSSGTIIATRFLNTPSNVNVAGLGAEITSAANLGSTKIVRGHTVQTGGSGSSIERYYDITIKGSGIDATLDFHYDDSEKNGLTESTFELYSSTDGGDTWISEGRDVIKTDHNIVSLGGIDILSKRWTLASNTSPVPVQLVSFSAILDEDKVVLLWQTATEVNNYGFEIERSSAEQISNQTTIWETLGFIQGSGNSNSPKEYSYIDDNPLSDGATYRLKQIDTDGKFEYYGEVVEVEGYNVTDVVKEILPTEYSLEQNYPNPFNPTSVITYSISEANFVVLKVFNSLGEIVSTIVNKYQPAGKFNVTFNASNLPSGIYFYSISVNGIREVKKMNLIK